MMHHNFQRSSVSCSLQAFVLLPFQLLWLPVLLPFQILLLPVQLPYHLLICFDVLNLKMARPLLLLSLHLQLALFFCSLAPECPSHLSVTYFFSQNLIAASQYERLKRRSNQQLQTLIVSVKAFFLFIHDFQILLSIIGSKYLKAMST